ncbi:MAG: hypothetical protein WA322_04750 [Pseudolabrys sp.]|jgi:putative ABC transport system substrate-binding protein
MKRREFITLLGGAAAAWPFLANAQQHTRRVAVLVGTANDSQGQSWLTGFQQKLRELGWSDGRDIQIDVIWGGADIEHIRTSAAEMVRSKPDIILVYSVRVFERGAAENC